MDDWGPGKARARRSFSHRGLVACCGAAFAVSLAYAHDHWPVPPPSTSLRPAASSKARTKIGINLFGLANYNRQRVFSNLISQSEWFSSRGKAWTAMPAGQLDEHGWVRFLLPGQTAPRPLTFPSAPYRTTAVRCRYRGSGKLTVGGAARRMGEGDHWLMIELMPTGAVDDGAWIELMRTDPEDPLRDIDCREPSHAPTERFDPQFIRDLEGFGIIRFLDWQRVNDNLPVDFRRRTTPDMSSQVGPAGAAIEDMVDLANLAGADPWFLMPYKAQPAYVRAFAQLVRDRLDPGRTVYVELGNEIWNDMFDASRQARREGLTLRLGNGDPAQAGALRYAQKLRETMRIWSEVFAGREGRLVRVAASQNANPDLADTVLAYSDTARWIDALATAPYIWVDLTRRSSTDVDSIFVQSFRAIDETIELADRNRSIAARYHKRFIAYEGGQHLVTPDLVLAGRLQRDRRMEALYRRYLEIWDARIGGELTLYASTAPIGPYGSWGLREYAGQPLEQAPKLRAVRQYMATHP
ncbi:MAG: hypothetical protein J7500_14380 [Sphingomonas sp.]|uniref:hypothetical protein n=1 Tax=Sphingomonas sp. TaxID=28214 RepID=UPI001B08236B|nr:hypothetical protein [Sphingomonas sp.]MBO9623892.1 hypothetical protein [Sphingomonas sp.]